MTVLEVLQNTAAYFAKKQVEHPRLNIEHLLADALGKKRIELYLEFDRPLSERELEPLREKVRRRAEGEPLQHLLGHWDFLGRRFKTDRRALIPRPETELLVETVLKKLATGRVRSDPTGRCRHWERRPGHYLRAGTATTRGCRGGYLETMRSRWLVRTRPVLGSQIESRSAKSDLLDRIDGPFHWIVANLPYIPAADIPGLQREVRFDPALALDGGEDGLTIIKRLIESIPGKIASNGLVALEARAGSGGTGCELIWLAKTIGTFQL